MRFITSLFLLLILQSLFSQSDYAKWEGSWKGQIQDPQALSLEVMATITAFNQYQIELVQDGKILLESPAKVDSGGIVEAKLGPLQFKGQCDEEGMLKYAFIRGLGCYEYSLPLTGQGKAWLGRWWPWHTPLMEPATVYIAIELSEGVPKIYPFFDEGRFPGTFATGFEEDAEGGIRFFDFLTGMEMKATLAENGMTLQWLVGDQVLTETSLTPFEGDFPVGFAYPDYAADPFQPKAIDQSFPAGVAKNLDPAPMQKMVKDIEAGTLTFTDAVLIAQEGKLIYENYFNGYGPENPHQVRSMQKSMASALAGVAIADGYISGVEAKMADYLPEKYLPLLKDDKRKSEISLYDLLTMSSGLDAIDFGIDRTSPGSEDQYQNTPDWTKTILSVPMINEPGAVANYSSANPALVGTMLHEATGKDLGMYQHEKLFHPLGIEAYVLQIAPDNQVYQGGGILMRPKDMLKFGQLYLNQGLWEGEQILPASWIEASMQNYLPLVNTNDKNGYGYYWWHRNYEINGKTIASVEARGAGGQYVFVIEELELVAVITSANYRNGRFFQPEIIMRDYILPAILK
ncbi:MAG: serine hydrolase [Bacteroidota bacterium]